MNAPAAASLRPAGVVQVIPVQLRVALIWRGEVMADHCQALPAPITLGASGKSTFIIPDVSLPADFGIIRPGNRGYLLTLSSGMRGTISIDGEKRAVYDFVRRGGEGGDGAGEFRATPIGGRDWGVIDLDETGHHQFFFQFVPIESPLLKDRLRLELLLPALAFSLLLHAVMLLVTYRFDDGADPFTYPGSANLTGRYIISRINPPEPPPDPPPMKGAAAAAPAASTGEKKKANTATKGDTGKSGGKGEEERARDPDAKDVPPDAPPPPPEVAFLKAENRQVLDDMLKTDIRTSLGKFTGLPGPKKVGGLGFGKGTGTGVGDEAGGTGTTRNGTGKGPGGGGEVEGDFVSQGKIDTGKARPQGPGGGGSGVKEVALVATGNASGDFGGLTKEEIDKVVRSRQGLIKSCYQRELDRTKGLGGKLVVAFSISPEGVVGRNKIDTGKSTLRNDAVEECVLRQIAKLKFPAKGGGVVTYPFIFSQG